MPKWQRSAPEQKQRSKRSRVLSNIVFAASLCLTVYSLVAETKPPLHVSLAASGFLLGVKLIIDWTSRKKSLAADSARR